MPDIQARLSFGVYTMDLCNGELRRSGVRVHLQAQPFRVLALLAERSGEIVGREEIEGLLWKNQTFVDFKAGLNFCICEIRKALEEDPIRPRFLETRRGRGYRFLSPVRKTYAKAPASAIARTVQRIPQHDSAYQRGSYYWSRRTEMDLTKAIGYFDLSIDRIPDNARAYAGLARTYVLLASSGPQQPLEMYRRAKLAADTALALDDDCADAHAALACCSMYSDWNWESAEASFQRAFDLDPLSATAHMWYADLLTATRRHEKAIAHIRMARELDPLSLQINADVAWVLLYAGYFIEAIEEYRRLIPIDPDFSPTHWGLGIAYGRAGRFAEATDSLQEAIACSGRSPSMLAALGHVLAQSGKKKEARDVLTQLRELSASRYVSAYDMAIVTWGIGDLEQTVDWLKKACGERPTEIVYLAVDPRFERFQALEHARQLTRRLGFVA